MLERKALRKEKGKKGRHAKLLQKTLGNEKWYGGGVGQGFGDIRKRGTEVHLLITVYHLTKPSACPRVYLGE